MGFAVMAARRAIVFAATISPEVERLLVGKLAYTLVLCGILISLLVVTGVFFLVRFFEAKEQAEDALARFARQQSVVADLGSLALEGEEVQVLMDEAVRLTAGALGVEMCKILKLEESGESLRLVAGVGWREGLVGEAMVGAELESQAGYTLHEGAPVIVKDLRSESRFSGPPLLHDHKVVSGISVPMVAGGFVFGVMGAHTTQRRDFSEDDIHFLEAMANVVTTAVLRKRAEEELRAAHEEMESFVLTVSSHDLRTPVITLQGYIKALREDYGEAFDETAKEYLDHIESGSAKLANVISSLLHLARTGRELGPRQVIPASDLIEGSLEELAPLLGERGVEFKVTCGPFQITCDPDRFAIVFTNLISNAIKYMGDQAAPLIEIGGEEHENEYRFFVRDNGMGIDSQYHAKVFELFQTLGKGEGTGVGLALVKKIVAAHGGRVWVESAVGQGSTFYFTLSKQPVEVDHRRGAVGHTAS